MSHVIVFVTEPGVIGYSGVINLHYWNNQI